MAPDSYHHGNDDDDGDDDGDGDEDGDGDDDGDGDGDDVNVDLDGKDCVAGLLCSSLLRKRLLVFRLTSLPP